MSKELVVPESNESEVLQLEKIKQTAYAHFHSVAMEEVMKADSYLKESIAGLEDKESYNRIHKIFNSDIKPAWKAIEDKRVSMKTPFDNASSIIQEAAKEWKAKLEPAKNHIDKILSDYRKLEKDEKERKANEEKAKIAKRESELFATGATFDGTWYSLGIEKASPNDIADDAEWVKTIGRFSEEKQRIDDNNRKAAEDARKKREELEQMADELVKSTRTSTLFKAGFSYEDGIFSRGDVSLSEATLHKVDEKDFEKMLIQQSVPDIEPLPIKSDTIEVDMKPSGNAIMHDNDIPKAESANAVSVKDPLKDAFGKVNGLGKFEIFLAGIEYGKSIS
jgi:hypothetical protein